MAEVKRDGDRILIGDRVIIERGPRLVSATATAEILHDDATASHYAVGKPDALGKTIKLGEAFSYLDYGGQKADGDHVFYVYEKVDLTDEDRARPGAETTDEFRWIERDTHGTEDEAVAFGQTIAGE